MIYNFFKRIFDVFFSILLIILFGPMMLLLMMLIIYKLGRPFLFKQKRPGLDGKIFIIYKFRTMLDSRNKKGGFLSDKERLTSFGRILRKTSLDELPELFNILKGNMSFVGPRPLLIEYLPLYNEEQKQRHLVKQGLTGWAQINGRNAISWDEKFKLDIWYVQNKSFYLDIKIIFNTLIKVLKRDGISQEGEVTMTKFRGN